MNVIKAKLLKRGNAGGEGRTLMGLPPLDFESSASTNSTTPAKSDSNLKV